MNPRDRQAVQGDAHGQPADPLVRFRDGDESAFQEILDEWGPVLLGFFERRTHDPELSEDLSQETFFRLFRHAHAYRPRGTFGAFLFQVARNLWIDSYRARRARINPTSLDRTNPRTEVPIGDTVASEGPGPVQESEETEQSRRLHALVDRLPENQRMCVELAIFGQMPYDRVGSLLGIPEGTVKSRMHYAMRKLRELAGEMDL